MSHACFRVNLHSTVAWMSWNSLLETGYGLWVPNFVAVSETSDIAPVLSKEFLDIQATVGYRFTLKHVCGMIIIYSQMHHTDKYSQRSSIIWTVWLNGLVFFDKLSDCGFESHCCHSCYFGLEFSGIDAQPIRLSDVLNLKSLKSIWDVKLISCFHCSYKKYDVLGYDPKILLDNQFAGVFTFDLFDLLILLLVVNCYIVLNNCLSC